MENLIIEGENLFVLQKMQEEYKNAIDLVIIDPPYNTNIDYIGYKDSNFANGWIEFIKPRIKLAYSLLSEKGVMFIHIDENELINLANLCYEIFKKQNVNILIWKKINELFDNNRIEKEVINIKSAHEYVLICYNNKSITTLNNMKQPIFQNNKWFDIEKPMETILDNLGTTSSAKDELNLLLGSRNVFSTPKPIRLFKEFVRVTTDKKSIILDFFAGSGTTAHSVMDLNKEDNGERKFIINTNDENNICQLVTIPRINNAIKLNQYAETYKYQFYK
jgi:adenine-specific DNA-methyltransferase